MLGRVAAPCGGVDNKVPQLRTTQSENLDYTFSYVSILKRRRLLPAQHAICAEHFQVSLKRGIGAESMNFKK